MRFKRSIFEGWQGLDENTAGAYNLKHTPITKEGRGLDVFGPLRYRKIRWILKVIFKLSIGCDTVEYNFVIFKSV